MPDYVRVREGDSEYSPQRHQISDPDAVEFLDKPALEPNGKPIPPKPVTPLGTPSAGSKQERQRATKTSGANSPGKDAGQTSATPETDSAA